MKDLQRASEAIAAGNKSEAHVLLAQAIKENPNDVDAWLLLSQTASSPEQKKTFLKRVLIIDPDNAAAQDGLAALDRGVAPASTLPLEDTTPPAAMAVPEAEAEPAIEPAAPAELETLVESSAASPSEPAADSDPLGGVDEAYVVEEAITPMPDLGADTIVVGAPEVTMIAEQIDDPPFEPTEDVFADPFDYDSQEEVVPAWLLGEVAADDPSLAVAEMDDLESRAPNADLAARPADETVEVADVASAEVVAAPTDSISADVRQEPTSKEAKKTKGQKAKRNGWLEWLAMIALIILFMLLIYAIFGAG